MTWLRDYAGDAIPPAGLREWAEQQPTAAAAWRQCPRADWQLWLAAHAPSLEHKEERAIIAAGIGALPDPPFLRWLLGVARPLPSTLDVLEAWSRDRRGKLGSAQRMMATNLAFFVALIIAVAIDRVWGTRFGVGTARTAAQAVMVVVLWLPLILFARGLWRALIDRSLARLSFASAFDLLRPRVARTAEAVPESEGARQAERVRLTLSGLATRLFS